MEQIGYILKMLYYLLFVIVMYAVALNSSKKYCQDITMERSKRIGVIVIRKKRFPIIAIVLLCLMAGYYGTICGQVPIASDRLNYAMRFSSDTFLDAVKQSSYGLYFIEKILHLFTYDPYVLFFTIPVICVALYLFAYNIWDDVIPLAILMFGFSACVNYSFYQYKQAPALGLMALSFAYFLRGRKLYAILFMIGAIAFHESALLMVPLYIVMMGSRKRWVRIAEIVFLLVCVFGFSYINVGLVRIASLIPGLNFQLQNYLGDSGGIQIDSNLATIFKGFPYYVITIVGIVQRPKLIDSIKNYDKYLTMSIFASACILLSAYMYWMWRFGSYTYFPILIFASLIYREMDTNRELFKWTVVLSLAFITFRAFAQFYFIYGGY